MANKTTHKIINRIKRTFQREVMLEIKDTKTLMAEENRETHRLLREIIVGQWKRDEKNLRGGSFTVSEREIATKLFNDMIMYLDPKDIAVVPHIILEGIWERQITEAWRRVMDEMDIKTVFDIGSNFGYFGMLAAQKVDRKKGKVVLFEANPRLVPYIHKNLSVNWLNENTVVENVAVSDKNGTETLNVLEDYTGSSSVHSMEKLTSYLSHKMNVKAEESVKIRAVTIDSYSKSEKINTIDLIKMDIEGYEEKAYLGMRGIVKNSPKTVMFIEFTKDGYDNPEAFYNMLLDDFRHLYTINGEGGLEKPTKNSYNDIVVPAADWVMLVFSKTSLSFVAS